MRLLFVIQGMRSGGAERVMSLLCSKATEKGHKVYLAITETMKDFAYELLPDVEIIDATSKENNVGTSRWAQIKALRAIYMDKKPDAVISFITRTNICAVLAGVFLDVPIVVSERNNPMVDPASKRTRMLRDLVYPLADGYVFQTQYAKECFSMKIQNRSVVIFNPVSDVVQNELNRAKDKRVIAVGRLEPQKNYSMMIQALSKVLPNHSAYHVDIFGTGGLHEQLQQEIDEVGMNDRIVMRGYTNQSIAEMARSEVFLMTSDFEGMPNALMEAMCVGCACISTDSPAYGARELIKDGENGYLIPVGDEMTLVERLEKILGDPVRLQEFGKRAKAVYYKFNADAIVDSWLAYIEQVRSKAK